MQPGHRIQSRVLLPITFAAFSLVALCATAQVSRPSARDGAMLDLTGYWVSVVTEDWVDRMLVPAKGDVGSIPVNDAGRAAAANWDPAAGTQEGDACRLYGAAGIIRQPGRLHITWQDEQTLRVDFSAGKQTRLLSFGTTTDAPAAVHSRQGSSTAQWVRVRNFNQQFGPPSVAPVGGTLKVSTNQLRAGYLQSNGVPYSENAKMTEYFDRISYKDHAWLIVTTVVDDPKYLREPLYWATHFKKEADGSKWMSKPCEAT